MTPLPSSQVAEAPSPLSDTHSSSSTMAQLEKPERSRNAKAQARHRAKRKAYIEQLETTVTKLQSVLALSPEQVSAIPPPVVRIRELENENISLRRENESLRHQLEEKIALLRPDITRRNITLPDDRRDDRDMKRRRTVDHAEDVYMSSHSPHMPSPPPPLLIPSSTQYPDSSHASSMGTHRHPTSQMYPSYNSSISYQLPPATPPGSSATSSPSAHSFSYPPPSNHADHHQRTPPSNHSTVLPRFSQAMGQYDFVKIEEDPYPNHGMSHSHSSYATGVASYSGPASNGHWQQSYSERA